MQFIKTAFVEAAFTADFAGALHRQPQKCAIWAKMWQNLQVIRIPRMEG
jgi:hypothetical protein